jgi:hypothetical protein
MVRHAIALVLALGALVAAPAGAGAAPIPTDPATTPPRAFDGGVATPRRLSSPEPPRHPFMAPNGRSNLHDDAFQTDAYRGPGPLGRGMGVRSTFKSADCASVTFDSRGRVVTVCVGVTSPTLEVLDPRTLESISSMPLPPRTSAGVNVFTDFSGGGYFYLDNRDRAVIPTSTRHVFVVAVRPSGALALQSDYDLSGAVPAGDKIISALPDFGGRIWFVSAAGVVGTLSPATGAVRSRALGEKIGNSFAVDDDGGVYVVTDRALYRFDAASDGSPRTTWQQPYRNSGQAKPGQTQRGSGTTPTVMAGGRLAITDNADPMNVVVYRRAARVSRPRRICEQPVFRRGASATDQSLIAARNSLVVENNYGYSGPAAVMNGASTEPGLERIDVKKDDSGCRTVWRSREIAPSVVPKLSLATGLVYTYTKPPRSDRVDPWYLTALNFCTGKREWRRLAGTGLGYNNNYAPVSLGPDGAAYVGALGGLVRLADSSTPRGPGRGARTGCAPAPRVKLFVRRVRRGSSKRCAVRVAVGGADRSLVRRVRFVAGRARARDRRRPFRGTLVTRARTVSAFARLRNGRALRLKGRAAHCRSLDVDAARP